jgi:Phage protein Gp138 N-terminal domain/GpV Apex motif
VSDVYLGNRVPGDDGDLLTAITFIARQVQEKGWTATLVKVLAVHDGGVGPPPTVDVQPTVNQIDGYSQPTAHGTIYSMPVARLQSGKGAIIIDPQVGDIGLACFASHDITAVIATGDVANPGSRRRFDPGDGLYVISLIGQTPTCYIQFTTDGTINVVVPSGQMVNITGNTAITGNLTVSGDVVAGGKSLEHHLHSGVQTGSGDTGPPV